MTQEHLAGKRSQLIMEGREGKNARQESGGTNHWKLLTGSLSDQLTSLHIASFLIQPRTPCPGTPPLTESRALLHKLTVKIIPDRQNPQLRLLQVIRGCVKLIANATRTREGELWLECIGERRFYYQ